MISFPDRIMEGVDDLIRGVRGLTKADHSTYFPIVCPHSTEVLALHNGSLLSVIKLNGYMGQYFPGAFDAIKDKWSDFLRNMSNDKSALGFDLYWSYEYDPQGMGLKTSHYRERMIEASERRGMDVRDILEEEAALYGRICANESQYLLLVTHIDCLPKADRKQATSRMGADSAKAIRGAGAMDLQRGIKGIEAVHEQHVNKVTTFLENAGKGYTYKRLDCYEALTAMRVSFTPDTTAEEWKPRLTMSDCRFRPTEDVKASEQQRQDKSVPLDWSFTMPSKLSEQMVPDGVVDLGKYVVVGSRTYAPMYVSELAVQPRPIEELLKMCHKRRLPMRLIFSLTSNSDVANYWNRLFASYFTFASSSNRQIHKADKAMKAYQEGNGSIFGYGISATTWADTEVSFNQDGSAQYTVAKLQRAASDLETLLQQWGGQQVDSIFGCSVEAVMGSTPGYCLPTSSPLAPQIEMDIVTQLPLMRPATLWSPEESIWFRTPEGILSPYQPMSSRQTSMLQLILGGMGYGKSNLLSENIFYFANHPGAKTMPYIRGVDFGASSAGVIDMIRESLPDDRKHEAVFEMFSANGKMIKNMLDCPLGMRYPLEDQKRFLVTWLMILCDDLIGPEGQVKDLASVLSATIQRAYEKRDDRHQLFESVVYDEKVANPDVEKARLKVGLEIDEHSNYWEVTDALIAYGLEHKDNAVLYAAKVAQRYCVPRFEDLIHSCDQLREQFKSMPDVKGKSMVEAVVNSLMNANSIFPVFSGITNTDISESRVCVFDMSEAFGRGTSKYDDWMRSVYFSVVYRLLTEDLFVNKTLSGDQIITHQDHLGLTDELVEHHLKYMEEQDQLIKLFWADELHRLGGAYGSLQMITSMSYEARKYRVGMILGTQMPQHIPEDVIKLCTSAFIFGVNQSSQIAATLGELFSLSEDEQKSVLEITKPVIFNPVVHFTAFKQPIYSARFPAICRG